MSFTIVTMSRGDEHRLAEWVGYHARLGFDEFHVVLDNPIDDSERVLRELDLPVKITVESRGPVGDYYDDVPRDQRWALVKKWREDHAEEVAASGMPTVDVLSWRQYRHLPEVLDRYVKRDGWLSLLDVDEFITIPAGKTIADVVEGAEHPRVRFYSFDVDTTGHDPARGYVEQHTMRWAREDVEAYGNGWGIRVKSIVRCDVALPLASVHGISRGGFVQLDPEDGRILHFKTPPSGLIPHTVDDRGAQGR